jgi:hypothetical protein
MGYQKVDLIFRDGHILKGVMVFNAEDCQSEEKFIVAEIEDIRIHKEGGGS